MNDGGTDLAPNSDIRAVTVPYPRLRRFFYEHPWSSQWVGSIGFSDHRQENTGGQRGDAFHSGK